MGRKKIRIDVYKIIGTHPVLETKNLMKFRSIVAALFIFMITPQGVIRAQHLDEIVKRHIDATGGANNWRKIKSMKVSLVLRGTGGYTYNTSTTIQGKGFRNDDYGSDFLDTTIYIYTATYDWTIMRGADQEVKREPHKTSKYYSDEFDSWDYLVDYKAKGRKLTYLGKGYANDKQCYLIKVAFLWGREVIMYIDTVNFYYIRSASKYLRMGKEIDYIQDFSDFKLLPEGILYAMRETGPDFEFVTRDIEINKEIDTILEPELLQHYK